MRQTLHGWAALGGAAALLIAMPAAGQNRVDRVGTIGLSVSGLYGAVTGNSRYGQEFSSGPGMAIGLRYVTSRHISLGLSFHSQRYDANETGQALDDLDLRMTDIRFDTYYYRDRGANAPQYFLVGIGLFRPEVRHSANEISFPTENLVLCAGMGAEVFIRETWGLDFSARATGYFGNGFSPEEIAAGDQTVSEGNFSAGFQGQIGLFYYLAR
jgi:hypothetical protein